MTTEQPPVVDAAPAPASIMKPLYAPAHYSEFGFDVGLGGATKMPAKFEAPTQDRNGLQVMVRVHSAAGTAAPGKRSRPESAGDVHGVRFPITAMTAFLRAVVATAPSRDALPDGWVFRDTEFDPTAPVGQVPERIGSTTLGMLILELCVRYYEEVSRELSVPQLYDLASDWLEHCGWDRLASAVPEFVAFAQEHASVLSDVEHECARLRAMVIGAVPPTQRYAAVAAAVQRAVGAVVRKRMRNSRCMAFTFRRISLDAGVKLLADGQRFGAAHALRAFGGFASCASCLVMPTVVLDSVLVALRLLEKIDRYNIGLLPDRFVFAAEAACIDAFVATVPERPLVAERGATTCCRVDPIIGALLDPRTQLSHVVDAAVALRHMFVRDVNPEPMIPQIRLDAAMRDRRKLAPTDSLDEYTRTVVCDQTDLYEGCQIRNGADLGAQLRLLPRILDSLYHGDIFGADHGLLHDLYLIHQMPREAEPPSAPAAKKRADDAPAEAQRRMDGLRLGPVAAAIPMQQSAMCEYSMPGSDDTRWLHSNLLAAIIGFLSYDRRHCLPFGLVKMLHGLIDGVITAQLRDAGSSFDIHAADIEPSARRGVIGDLVYGLLMNTVMDYLTSPAFDAAEPLTIRCGAALTQYYKLCGDARLDAQARRVLFCCLTCLTTPLGDPMVCAFPKEHPHTSNHASCGEHGGGPTVVVADGEPIDAVFDRVNEACDGTMALRVVVDVAAHGATQPFAAATDGGELVLRFGPDMYKHVTVPPARPTPEQRRARAAAPVVHPKKARKAAAAAGATPDGTPPTSPPQDAATVPCDAFGATIVHSTDPQVVTLASGERVLAGFTPDVDWPSARAKPRPETLGGAGVSLCTPSPPRFRADDTPNGVGALWLSSGALAPPRDARLFGRFVATDTAGRCAWCLGATGPDDPLEGAAVIGSALCCKCTADGVTLGFHPRCIAAARTAIPDPVCIAQPARHGERPASGSSVFVVPAVPMAPHQCSVCGKATPCQVVWTYVPTAAGVRRYDMCDQRCATTFGAACLVHDLVRADAVPFYTTSKDVTMCTPQGPITAF